MSTARELPKESWQKYFDAISGVVAGSRAEIEVASLDVGDQVVNEWLPLLGITYDSRDDLLDVSLTGLTHLIRKPAYIEVSEDAGAIRSISVRTSDGTLEVIRLRQPLRLPAAV